MRKVFCALSLATALALTGCGPSSTTPNDKGPAPVPSGPGVIAPGNTTIEFVGTKPNGKHNGGFKSFSGEVKPIDADITASTISLKIDTDSLHTDADPKLGNHLRAPDFFDVKKFPEATFVSKEIKAEKKGDSTHTITGDLTLHGTTKTITIPAKVNQTADTLSIDSTFTIDRTEYGITFNPAQVDKDVTITVSAKVARK